MRGDDMYRDKYFAIQKLLDEVLGTEDEDGAGDGIVADVHLALNRAERRGAVKALRFAARDLNGCVPGLVATGLDTMADAIASGEVTL